MKAIGYLMIAIAFLAGAYMSVRHETLVEAAPFIMTLVLGSVGIVLVRLATKQQSQHKEVLTSNLKTLEDSLNRLVADTAEFERTKDTINVYDLRHHIERTFAGPLGDFVEARESLAHAHGLQTYAEVMSQFSAGERYINRVWSASTDGYIDEAHVYITKAAAQFQEARETMQRLTA